MDVNLLDNDLLDQDASLCVCQGRQSLDILKDVQKAYEERIELINKTGGKNKLQKELELLRSWVGDLVEQNGLLARAVEEMETEISSRVVFERRRNIEIESELRAEVSALRRGLARKDSDVRGLLELLRRLRDGDRRDIHGIRFYEVTECDIFGITGKPDLKCDDRQNDMTHKSLYGEARNYDEYVTMLLLQWDQKKNICDKVNELKVLNDSLKKDNSSKDREIRKLTSELRQREQTIATLNIETSIDRQVPTKDEAVMTEADFPINECGDVVPAMKYPENNDHHQLDVKTKSSNESIRAIRKENVDLREEVRAMSQLCAALYEQRLAAVLRLQFRDDIIREMRRQLCQAKAKLEVSKSLKSVAGECEESGGRRLRKPRRRDGPEGGWSNRSDPSPDGSVSLQLD